MSLVLLPELILKDAIDKALNFARQDYANTTDKNKSWLALCFKDLIIDDYDFFQQVVGIICTDVDNPRHFKGDLMFNAKKNNLPSFHITLPAESPTDNSLGIGEVEENNLQQSDGFRQVFSRRIQTNYNVVVVSDNTQEVIVLYHLMRTMLIALLPHLHLSGLVNVTFAGQDINPYRDLAPTLYMRAISLGVQYETYSPSLQLDLYPTDVTVQGHAQDE